MKKVIFEQNEQVIRLEDVTDDMIIGLTWHDDDKSFLIKNHENKTVGIGLNRLTTLNNWTAKTHKDYIKNAALIKNVLIFDSPKELAQWLAE